MSRGMQTQHSNTEKGGGVMHGERRQSQSKIKECRIKLNKQWLDNPGQHCADCPYYCVKTAAR